MSVVFIDECSEIPDADRRSVPTTGGRCERRADRFLPDFCGASPSAWPTEAPAAGRRRVLLVDDSDSVRETLADLLETDGFYAVQAADAAEAVMLMRQGPAFDVLVTDLSMPGADGITLIHQARQIQSDIPAILLTGYAEQMTSVAAIAGGSFPILRKPVEGDHLVEQITVLTQRPRNA